jgi:hypothetical protein
VDGTLIRTDRCAAPGPTVRGDRPDQRVDLWWSGKHGCQGLAALLDGQVHLRRQPAAGAAQRVIGRLADRRHALFLGMTAGAGGVGVSPVNRGVHRHHPLDQPGLGADRLRPVRIAAHLPACGYTADYATA